MVNTSAMTTKTLTYLFDPLCGWCYGASPAIQQAVTPLPARKLGRTAFYSEAA